MALSEAAGRKTTPAMASGLADHVWSGAELLERAAQLLGGAGCLLTLAAGRGNMRGRMSR